MNWFATATLTAQLPDEGGLRTAAYGLRNAGDALAAQASVTRSVGDAIGPGVWHDDASGQAKALLAELADELGTGSSAMYRSADALDTLASYVGTQHGRYEETGRLLEQMALDPVGDIAHHELAEAESLIEERHSIEWNVGAAMGHAGEIISHAAAQATRYHGSGGKSVWSRIEHYTADFVSGAWDGTYAMGKGLFAFGVLAAKLSPERMMVDPAGYLHDAEHAAMTAWTTGDEIAHDKKQFVENLLDLKELKSDPVHWAGELAPTIALTLLSGGLGAASKGADGIEAADATATAAAKASEVTSSLPTQTIEHVTDGMIKDDGYGRPVGFHSAPGGIAPTGRRIDQVISINSNGTYQARVSFLRPNGVWVTKSVDIHTMFPDSWSRTDVIHAVQEAFNNRVMIKPYKWQGSYDGVEIEGYIDKNTGEPITAYPTPDQ